MVYNCSCCISFKEYPLCSNGIEGVLWLGRKIMSIVACLHEGVKWICAKICALFSCCRLEEAVGQSVSKGLEEENKPVKIPQETDQELEPLKQEGIPIIAKELTADPAPEPTPITGNPDPLSVRTSSGLSSGGKSGETPTPLVSNKDKMNFSGCTLRGPSGDPYPTGSYTLIEPSIEPSIKQEN